MLYLYYIHSIENSVVLISKRVSFRYYLLIDILFNFIWTISPSCLDIEQHKVGLLITGQKDTWTLKVLVMNSILSVYGLFNSRVDIHLFINKNYVFYSEGK